MSWVARKVAGLDNEDIYAIQEEYFKIKRKEKELLQETLFWDTYEDEYYNG